jgi:hypothetical protein
MSELDDFLTPTLSRQLEAEQALINGDPTPRLAMWSTQDPVTVFGRDRTTIGSEEVRQAFHWLATRVSNRLPLRARGRRRQRGPGLHPRLRTHHLLHRWRPGRAADPVGHHLYRREDGEWKTVHRHADDPPTGPLSPAEASTE